MTPNILNELWRGDLFHHHLGASGMINTVKQQLSRRQQLYLSDIWAEIDNNPVRHIPWDIVEKLRYRQE